MNIIAAISKQWGLGKDNELLFHISGDMRRFKEMTYGNYVIMGRKTLASLPGGKPLEGRGNIVLSKTLPLDTAGVTVCRDVEELLQVTQGIVKEKLFVIGGAEIYRLLEPLCSKAYITWVDDAPEADCFLPNLDESPHWRITNESQFMENKGFIFQYIDYERIPEFTK